jgi:hypothetical protein
MRYARTFVGKHGSFASLRFLPLQWLIGMSGLQLGLLDPTGLPVAGAEVARKALDPAAVPSNLLMKRTIADELL